MRSKELYNIIDGYAPFALSKEYIARGHHDNSGLLVDCGGEVSGILFSLDLAGISASSGSACSSASLDPSRTLLSIGVPVGTAHGSIRFTFGKHNTVEDVD